MLNIHIQQIDDCNQMYVLDTGYVGEKLTCPAQILIFNLTTDRLIKKIKIPHDKSHNENNKGRLVNPVVEYSGENCKLENVREEYYDNSATE